MKASAAPAAPAAAPAVGPTLTGRHVRLRPIYPTDYEYLYTLATHEKLGWRWRFRGSTPSPEAFAQLLWQSVLAQFVVERIEDGKRIGHVQAFDANERNGWCHIGILLDPGVSKTGWALEALLLFLDYVFTVWNFRKLYAEVAEFNYEQFGSGANGVFRVEGRLVGHEYYGDRFWDTIVLALYREDFMRDWHPRVAQLAAPAAAPRPEGATE